MKNMSFETRKKISLVSIIVIIACLIYFWNEYDKTQKELDKLFQNEITNNLSVYGSAIDHVYANGNYVGVYINRSMWNASSDSTQDTFIKEVCVIVNELGRKYEKSDFLISFYTSDKKDIITLTLKGKK